MHKTIYIDVDEEITSVIDRLRSEIGVEEIFLVIPKEALLTHGIINLKILKKEASRLGKKIIISTQDEQVKKVIERLGIMAGDIPRPAQENVVPTRPNQPNNVLAEQASQEALRAVSGQEDYVRKNEKTIGSDSFFNTERSDNLSVERERNLGKTNKKRINLIGAKKSINDKINENSQVTESFGEVNANGQLFSDQFNNKTDASLPREQYLTENKTLLSGRNNFKNQHPLAENDFNGNNKRRFNFKIILALGLAVFILGGIFWTIRHYPKLEVIVYPRKKELQREVRIFAKVGVTKEDPDKKIIPGRILEMELIKEKEFEATGESFSGKDGRAKGVVEIINEYSTASQPLVATTRILSQEGKLFRLTKGVVVPGMKDGSPGKVSVSVIADKVGEDYNIGATTFTIEGFKGSNKYEKFKVISSSEMKGGGRADNSNKTKIISENDLKKARKETIKELEDEISKKIKEKIGEKDRVIFESIDKQIEEAKSAYPLGTEVDKFTYTVKEKIKAIVFSEEAVNKIGRSELKKEAGSDFDLAETTELTYKKAIADFNQGELIIHLNVKAEAWSKVDLEKIKDELANKKEKGIKEFLSNQATINKAEIIFHPSWLRRIKIKRDKVIVNKVLEK